MTRDKIMRLLARDPTAGLKRAREWMNSPDPYLVADAVVVFADMGGHQEDLNAAKEAFQQAMDRERTAAHANQQ